MNFCSIKPLLLILPLTGIVSLGHADEASDNGSPYVEKYKVGYAETKPAFGGPTSPQGQLEEADRIKDPAFRFPAIDAFFQPCTDTRKSLHEKHGVQLNGHYSVMFQGMDAYHAQEDSAAGGVLRVNMRWTAVGGGTKNTGSLFVTLDHRHSFTDVAPQSLAGSAGYLGVASTFYNDMGGAIINLNWQQAFNDGDTGLIAGRYDPNDYQTAQGSTNPWTLFSNIAISLDPSVAFPDSSWGIGAGHWLNTQFYLLGGVNDANGLGSDNLEFFEGGSELYKYAHVGWSPSKDQRYFKNVHLSTWHVDDRDLRPEDGFSGAEASHGVTLSTNWMFEGLWMPFARAGWSDGSAPLYNESATLGVLKKLHYRSDVLGVAANWGKPSNDALREQTSIETFWQFQFSQNLEITPSIQYLNQPALNTDVDDIWLLSTRVHLTF